jgi:hypothetical protein
VHNVQGRPEAARRALERALPSLIALGAAAETRLHGFIADPEVTARATLSLPLLHLGKLRQAQAQLDQARQRAASLGQPMAELVALWFEALFAIRVDQPVASAAASMAALVERYALAQGSTACRWFQGWADAQQGRTEHAYASIRAAHDENLALGMLSGSSETLAYAVQAQLAAGEIGGARAVLGEAFARVEQLGERIYLPQLHLLDSALARRAGEPTRVPSAIRAAIAEAREQGAAWLELLALSELFTHAQPDAHERAALAQLRDSLDEAQDAPAVLHARALLAAND